MTAEATRRALLGGGALAAGALVVPACSSKKSSGTGPRAGGASNGDLVVASLAAALENLAVNSYQSALDAVGAGRLGTVPPALTTMLTTARQHHRQHAAAWNALLTGAGRPAVTAVDTTVRALVVEPGLTQMRFPADLARLALALENISAANYLNAIQIVLQSAGALKIAATVQPVEMQHAAFLSFLLGQYPVPDSFARTDGARPASDEIG